eukprot:PhF_6_TR1548/c0_g1_i1/m.2820
MSTGPYVSPMLKPANVSPPSQPSNAWATTTTTTTTPPPFSMPTTVEKTNAATSGDKNKGTDPNKYKTAICRNWEQQGTCTFRGCTFAHGRDELRLPRAGGVPSPVLSATSAATTTGAPKTPSQDGGGSSGGGTSPAIPPIAMPPSTVNTSKIDQLIHELAIEIRKERENVQVTQDANRTLEMVLRREQNDRLEREKEREHLAERVQQLESTVEQLQAALALHAATRGVDGTLNSKGNGTPASPQHNDMSQLRNLLSSLQSLPPS